MDFLKSVLGDDYSRFSEKIKSYNDAHPERRIKLCDLSEGNYVSKAKYRDLEAQTERLKESLSLYDGADDPDGAKTKLCDLMEKYEKDTEGLKKELTKARLSGAVDLALEKSGARNIKALRALIDFDKVCLTDDGLEGLDFQLEEIRKENGYLFKHSSVSTALKQGDKHPEVDGFVASAREAAGLK